MTEQERIANVGAGVTPTYHATESIEEAKAVVEQCMSATERLRRRLDERGVEWSDGTFEGGVPNNRRTFWGEGGMYCAEECFEADLRVCFYTTPEQAVEATLGRGTCHAEEVCLGIHSDLTATVCSACHIAVDDLEDCDYCPWCGAKVVDE